SLHKPKSKLILYWGLPFGNSNVKERSQEECEVTYDRNRLKEVGMVAFHFTTLTKNDIPWTNYRDPDQIYVWWTAESPTYGYNRKDLDRYENFFNWTWTYKQNAEGHRGYGNRAIALSAVKRGKLVVDQIVASKDKMAMWYVSNCGGKQGSNKRMQYYKHLVLAGLSVSTFGRCFPGSETIPRSFPTKYPEHLKRHKFYLAFENSFHCKDYITEKFWDNSLRNDMVPVVWGPTKEDVLSVAPLDSFIHCDDFESPAKLAEYLKFLDRNDDEYRKYFRWREDASITNEEMAKQTQEKYPNIEVHVKSKSLCMEYIQNKDTKTIKSLYQEFIGSDRPECTA
uniref:Fucosyltransferase n=1 Tax=Ciona savignyi TaxID=51511 RepID=H2Y7B4_CIOSA